LAHVGRRPWASRGRQPEIAVLGGSQGIIRRGRVTAEGWTAGGRGWAAAPAGGCRQDQQPSGPEPMPARSGHETVPARAGRGPKRDRSFGTKRPPDCTGGKDRQTTAI